MVLLCYRLVFGESRDANFITELEDWQYIPGIGDSILLGGHWLKIVDRWWDANGQLVKLYLK